MTLTVEIRDAEKASIGEAEVEIYLDKEGLEFLISQLEILRSGRDSHIHLRSESWGGWELGEKPLGENTTLVHQALIQLVPPDKVSSSKA